MHCCRDCYLQAKSWHFSHGCLAFPFLPLDKCTARLACSLLITEVTRLLGFSLAENFSPALIGRHNTAADTPVAHMGGMEEREEGKERMASEPGAARHGNFINYYEFHPPEERLRLLPDNFGSRISADQGATLVLDVGCNAGVSSPSSSFFQIEARQPHHGTAGCSTTWQPYSL